MHQDAGPNMSELIRNSSLGTPDAQLIRAVTPDAVVARVVGADEEPWARRAEGVVDGDAPTPVQPVVGRVVKVTIDDQGRGISPEGLVDAVVTRAIQEEARAAIAAEEARRYRTLRFVSAAAGVIIASIAAAAAAGVAGAVDVDRLPPTVLFLCANLLTALGIALRTRMASRTIETTASDYRLHLRYRLRNPLSQPTVTATLNSGDTCQLIESGGYQRPGLPPGPNGPGLSSYGG